MISRFKRHAGSPRQRRSIVLVALAAMLVPAAIAFACNPQAHLSLNKSAYSPGETIAVSGSYFKSSGSYSVTSSGGGIASTGGANWSTTLTAPSQAGSYTVTAASSGAYISGLPKTASFQVVDPSTATAPAATDSGQTFQEPKVGGVSGGGSTVDNGAGQQAFAGSVAASPGSGAFFSGAGAATAATVQPSERAAVSDVWSGFTAGKTPSLTAGVGMPDGGTGSGFSLGLVLMALGLVALIGGLTTAEVMRRKAQAS